MNQRKTNLEYRMYGFVPYNISPIQQGIQFGHAVVEYGLHYGKTSEYKQWANEDKTFIILNGGTTNNSTPDKFGTMNMLQIDLNVWKIDYAAFHEPDLGDQLTALVFLVDERVWNYEKYPDYDDETSSIGDVFWYRKLWGEKDWRWLLDQRQFLANKKLA
jgi:hypothetical protein